MRTQGEVDYNDAMIQDRQQGIEDIHEQILEVNEIFQDLAVLVNDQVFACTLHYTFSLLFRRVHLRSYRLYSTPLNCLCHQAQRMEYIACCPMWETNTLSSALQAFPVSQFFNISYPCSRCAAASGGGSSMITRQQCLFSRVGRSSAVSPCNWEQFW